MPPQPRVAGEWCLSGRVAGRRAALTRTPNLSGTFLLNEQSEGSIPNRIAAMRVASKLLTLSLLFIISSLMVEAFDIALHEGAIRQRTSSGGWKPRKTVDNGPYPTKCASLFVSNQEECGCPTTITSGKPSKKALSINPREEITKSTVFTLNGEVITMNQLLPSNDDGVSIVVFLRSFG